MTEETGVTLAEWAAAQALVATVGSSVLVAMLVARGVLPSDALESWRAQIGAEIGSIPASALGGDAVKALALRAASGLN